MRRRLALWLLGCTECRGLVWPGQGQGHRAFHAACAHRVRQAQWNRARDAYGAGVMPAGFTCVDCGWVPA